VPLLVGKKGLPERKRSSPGSLCEQFFGVDILRQFNQRTFLLGESSTPLGNEFESESSMAMQRSP
jgi:hypothetical protein